MIASAGFPDEVPEIGYVDVGGGTIAFQVFGSGPDLVVVPGLLGHLEAIWEIPEFARLNRSLARDWRVVIFDKRGTGMSDRLPRGQEFRLEERMEDIAAVMDAAGVESAVLSAQADGVPSATLFAATYPERVASLLVYAASARMLPAADYPYGVRWEIWERHLSELERRWGDTHNPAAVEVVSPSRAHDSTWRHTLARLQRLSCTPKAACEYLKAVVKLDIRDVLPAIQAPTLVAHAAGDLLYSVEQARWFAEHVAGAQFVIQEQTDHLAAGTFRAETLEFLTGHRPPSPEESALATILFTDIVDSTRQASQMGDAKWRALIDHHDQMIRRQLKRYGGREIKSTGDGFLATFDGPAAAIEAASAMLDGARMLGIELRAGLHAGVVELRGNDIGGLAVNVAARVQSCATPSEILVSRTIADLLTGSGFTFADRGSHTLKGVPGDWQLYAVS